MLFLNISQKSQEKTLCQNLFFKKSYRPQVCNFIKRENLAQMFCFEFCKIFKNTFFTKHLLTTASVMMKQLEYIELLTFRWILFRNFQNHVNSFMKEVPIGTSLRGKCPNTEFFLVRIFLYSDWIRRENLRIQAEYWKIRTRKNSVFGHFSRSASVMKQLISFHITLFIYFFITVKTTWEQTLAYGAQIYRAYIPTTTCITCCSKKLD